MSPGFVGVLVLAVLPACALVERPGPTRPRYQEQSQTIEAPRTVLERAVSDWIDARDWWLARQNPDGTIIALSPTESADGLVTRERWIFRVGEHEVSVQAFLDYVKDGAWRSSEEVCTTYRYAREHQALDDLAARAASYRQAHRGQARLTPRLSP